MEPDPIEFFGECMNSPQSGRTPLANEIYVSYIIIAYMYYTQIQAFLTTIGWPSN